MKALLVISLLFLMVLPCRASHIVGGEMIYSYAGPGAAANTRKYIITLKLFRDQNCDSQPGGCAQMPPDVYIGIYNNDNGKEFPATNQFYDVIKNSETSVAVDPFPACISDPPNLNYHVATYTFSVDLPINTKGYSATYQTCCRVHPLENVLNNAGSQNGGTGSSYSCSIPGVIDNCAQFTTSVDAICQKKKFTLKFNATDADADSLVYSFAPAYNGGASVNSSNVNPDPPPYGSVSYINGYNFDFPLGTQATINSRTGLISGIAPEVGKYVVCVSVLAYRNGSLLTEHRKDFIVNVTDCDFAGVQLDPQPVSCDGFSVSFSNNNNSSQNKTYYWEFGDPASGASDTSTLQTPTHVYTDTGSFTYKLIVNKGQSCADSATQIRKVYPGFFPGFITQGSCAKTGIKFIDTTKTRYGSVNAWHWDFGDPSATNDTSDVQNPVYTFPVTGNYPVQLQVSNSKGCLKTITDTVAIIDKPIFKVTDDTLICSIDTLQLMATGIGSIVWSPAYNINNTTSFTPLVSPKSTTTYSATLTESPGCFATHTVTVNVVNRVTLDAGNDSTVCQTDSTRINTASDGLHFLWTPATYLNNNTIKNPLADPPATTTFHVVASIGKCNTSDDVTFRVVPYPDAHAGNDTTICYPNSVQLNASGGVSYLWVPSIFLNDNKIPDPIATPQTSIRYIVAVTDNKGCPKPAFDTVLVIVQKIVADAGPRDTSVVVNQPLQLIGSGAEVFKWSPSTGLSDPDIANPIATLTDNQQYVLKVTSSEGCSATDTIDIIVYKVEPGLYVPNAFTPNGDGLNDTFRPVPIGMKYLRYFKVYNRDGQLIFSTSIQNLGWDGTFKGKPQDGDTYVWIAQGIDYQNKVIFKKGSVTLIR